MDIYHFDVTALVCTVIVFILATIGYFSNIVKLVNLDFETPVKAEILRSTGIVLPIVGVFEGYLDIKDN